MVVVIFFSPKPRPYSGNSATWLWLKIPKKWFYPQKNLQHRMAMLILDTPNIRIRLKMGYTPNYGQLIWATRIFPGRSQGLPSRRLWSASALRRSHHSWDGDQGDHAVHAGTLMVNWVNHAQFTQSETTWNKKHDRDGNLGLMLPDRLRNIPDTTLDNIVVFQISSCEQVFVTRDLYVWWCL